jgi:hypothetical protein
VRFRWLLFGLIAIAATVLGLFGLAHVGLCDSGDCPGDIEEAFWGVLFYGGATTTIVCGVGGFLSWHSHRTRAGQLPEPAWYPDPDDPHGTYRYWDGSSWTGDRSPRGGPDRG